MNWLQFISSIIGTIAWPVAVVVIMYVLRNPIKELIPLLQRMKYKGFELEFGERLAEAKEEADFDSGAETAVEISPEERRILELARVSPRAAVTEAWRWVEIASLDAANNLLGEDFRHKTLTFRAMRRLEQDEKIDRGAISVMRDLRGLRNHAAHSPEFALTSESALEYAQMARQLVGYFKTVSKSDNKKPPSLS